MVAVSDTLQRAMPVPLSRSLPQDTMGTPPACCKSNPKEGQEMHGDTCIWRPVVAVQEAGSGHAGPAGCCEGQQRTDGEHTDRIMAGPAN